MSVFTPNLYLNSITDIDLSLLKTYGIKGIVLDIDNTLTLHNSQDVLEEVLNWISLMKKSGIALTIVSNNSEERVRPFAKKLGLKYVSFGCKPLTAGFTKACKQFLLDTKEIAVVGDQIYTDILGANLKGMFSILVVPFQLENSAFFKFKRKMEQLHINKYYRRKNKS